jgi:hypothetical protein
VTSSGEFSPEALEARLGPDLYAACVQAAQAAPPPTPAVVERVRLIFAPGLRALRGRQVGMFERQVDPDGVLPQAERTRRAEAARKAHYAEMARRSLAARRAKKAQTNPNT